MLAGTILQSGKYTIIQEIGRGGFGITFKAVHHYLNHEVVMKTINEKLRQHPDFPKFQHQFQNEARRLATCVHPHIVRVSDYFEEDGLPYMVMEYIPGETLHAAYILPGIPLPESTAIHYISQIGAALEVVHSQGLLHRDIKPDNIILRQGTQDVVLIDFGIAREFNNGAKQTHTGLVSEGFSPIEQYLTQAPRTAATDVYGLAATLYALLTSEIPVPALLRDRQPMPEPRELQPNLSIAVNQAVMSGMALEAHLRPGTVKEWLQLLPKTELNFTNTKTFTQSVPTINLSDHLSNDSLPNILQKQSEKSPSLLGNKADKKLGISPMFIGFGVALLASITGFAMIRTLHKPHLNSSPSFNQNSSPNSVFTKPNYSSPTVSPSEKDITGDNNRNKNSTSSESNTSNKTSHRSERKYRRERFNNQPNSKSGNINNGEELSPKNNYNPNSQSSPEPKAEVKRSTEPISTQSPKSPKSPVSTPEVLSSPSLMDKLRDAKDSEQDTSTPLLKNDNLTPNNTPKSTQSENITSPRELSEGTGVVVPTLETQPNVIERNSRESQPQNDNKSLEKQPVQNNINNN